MPIRSYQNKHPDIATSAYVDDAAVVIRDVTIGEDTSLWPTVVARGDVGAIVIGARTNIQDGRSCSLPLTIAEHDVDNPFTVVVGAAEGRRANKTSCVLCHQPKSFDWRVPRASPRPQHSLAGYGVGAEQRVNLQSNVC